MPDDQLQLYGVPVVVSSLVSRSTVLVVGARDTVVMHPVTWLRNRYPRSPVWCERTAGHREMTRDRRRHAR